MPTLPVSFKKTSRDMKLYLAVMSKEERSDFVKKAIEFYSELPPLIEVDGFLVNTTTVASLPKLSRLFQPL